MDPWRFIYTGPQSVSPWLSPLDADWGRVCESSSLRPLHQDGVALHVLADDLRQARCDVPCPGEAIAVVQLQSSLEHAHRKIGRLEQAAVEQSLQHLVALDYVNRKVVELESRCRHQERELKMRDVRIGCLRSVFERHPHFSNCPTLSGPRHHHPEASGPAIVAASRRQLREASQVFEPDCLHFADAYYGCRVSQGESPNVGELEELLTQFLMLGCTMTELRCLYARGGGSPPWGLEQWEGHFQKHFAGFCPSLHDKFSLLLAVLHFMSN